MKLHQLNPDKIEAQADVCFITAKRLCLLENN